MILDFRNQIYYLNAAFFKIKDSQFFLFILLFLNLYYLKYAKNLFFAPLFVIYIFNYIKILSLIILSIMYFLLILIENQDKLVIYQQTVIDSLNNI